jgi:Tfp pilus assembly protein PilN
MYVRLNLATKPLVSHRQFFIGSAAVGALAGILFVLLAWHYWSVRKTEVNFRARTDKVERETAALESQKAELDRYFARPENHSVQDRAQFSNTVIEARSFNWTKMFMDLEKTLPAGAHILRIEPKLDRGSAEVKFLVGTSSEEAEIQLLKAFEDSKSFSHVELFSSQVPKGQGLTDALTVEFSAIYTGI